MNSAQLLPFCLRIYKRATVPFFYSVIINSAREIARHRRPVFERGGQIKCTRDGIDLSRLSDQNNTRPARLFSNYTKDETSLDNKRNRGEFPGGSGCGEADIFNRELKTTNQLRTTYDSTNLRQRSILEFRVHI